MELHMGRNTSRVQAKFLACTVRRRRIRRGRHGRFMGAGGGSETAAVRSAHVAGLQVRRRRRVQATPTATGSAHAPSPRQSPRPMSSTPGRIRTSMPRPSTTLKKDPAKDIMKKLGGGRRCLHRRPLHQLPHAHRPRPTCACPSTASTRASPAAPATARTRSGPTRTTREGGANDLRKKAGYATPDAEKPALQHDLARAPEAAQGVGPLRHPPDPRPRREVHVLPPSRSTPS